MTEKREERGWYWHCHACDSYVPRENLWCACGAPKVRRGSPPPAEPPSLDRTLVWEAGAILLLGGLSLLWVLLE
jgi:hypothetical protein